MPLSAPLGDREAIDGATGRPPHDIDDFEDVERKYRAWIMETDIDSLKCLPMP